MSDIKTENLRMKRRLDYIEDLIRQASIVIEDAIEEKKENSELVGDYIKGQLSGVAHCLRIVNESK